MHRAQLRCNRYLTCGPSPSPVWNPPGARERSAPYLSSPIHARDASLPQAHLLRASPSPIAASAAPPRPIAAVVASPPAWTTRPLDAGVPPAPCRTASPAHSASSRSTEHSARRLLLSPLLRTAQPLHSLLSISSESREHRRRSASRLRAPLRRNLS